MKKTTKRIIVIIAAAVIVLALCAAVVILFVRPEKGELDGIKVVDSQSELKGVSAEIVVSEIDTKEPYITVKWKNKTLKQIDIDIPFELYREVNGKWEKSEFEKEPERDAFIETIMELDSFEKNYSLRYVELSEGEKYRFLVKVSENEAEYKVWIDFEVTEKISRYYFNATILERVYDRDEEGRDTGYIIVCPFADEPERKTSDKIQVYCDTEYADVISEFAEKGSIVRILYDGRIEETYPAKLPKVYEIEHIFEEEEISETFDATVMNVTTSSFLVTPLEGESELSISDKIYVNKRDLDSEMIAGIIEGSVIRITYDGTVEETYPAKIPNVYKIEYLRGDFSSEPEIVLPLELTKDSIPNTKDWKTKGLERAGLSGVEISEPYSASFGDLYVLKHYNVSGVYHDTFFAIETEDVVYLQIISELTMISDVFICDVNGENGDEIVIQEYSGNAVKTTTAFVFDEGKVLEIFSTLGFGEKTFDTGYSFELCAPHRVIIKNQYTSYETVYDFPSESKEFEEVFDDNGTPVKNKSVWFWYTEVLPSDTDGDGVYELVARQNTCLLNNADNFGRCISILKYDKKAGGFKVIDAKFEERIYSSDLYHISYEAYIYTYTIYDRNGDVIFKDSNWREPKITMVSDDIVELCIQTGTGLSTNWAIFFDVETGEPSETYHHVLGAEGDYVIFGDYDSETDERSIVVQNIFDSSRYYKKYVLEDASSLSADFAAIEPLAYGRWEITYLVGEDYKQEKLVIQLPDW